MLITVRWNIEARRWVFADSEISRWCKSQSFEIQKLQIACTSFSEAVYIDTRFLIICRRQKCAYIIASDWNGCTTTIHEKNIASLYSIDKSVSLFFRGQISSLKCILLYAPATCYLNLVSETLTSKLASAAHRLN